jgi:diguanylate cyclase (GGDEF)-like protein
MQRCTKSSPPLTVLVVAKERGILRHLSRFLNTFGYRVQQVADSERALSLLETAPPDLLIADGDPAFRTTLDFCRRASGQKRLQYIYTLLLVNSATSIDLVEALEAGVDDFLRKPLVYGELLVRLRAGARALEFERRVRQQADTDPLTGLPSRTAFYERLRRHCKRSEEDAAETACVLLDVDFLRQINRREGRRAGDAVLRAVADRLRSIVEESAFLSAFAGGRFCALLPETSTDQAAEWAEGARAALSEMEVSVGDVAFRPTASFGIASCRADSDAGENLVAQAREALEQAKNSGRDCVVRFGEFDDEAKTWRDLAVPGKLFEKTVARDVMTLLTILIGPDQTIGQAAAFFRQTGLESLVVVDDDGKLRGIVSAESVLSDSTVWDQAAGLVSDVMSTEVVGLDEQAEFAVLMGLFAGGSPAPVVITSEGKPTGLVTPDALASLSAPLYRDSFQSGIPSTTTDYLLVQDFASTETA